MQPLTTTAQWTLADPAQQPKIKFEIEVGGGWIPIHEFPAPGGKNYVKDVSFTTGGARLTPNPVAAQFSAIIYNPDNIFHPFHPTSGCQGYFRAGRRVRISLGGNYPASGPWAGGDEYWQRIIGYMDEPNISSSERELNIMGLDYTRRLSDMKFTKEPSTYLPTPIDNYWGGLHNVPSQRTANFGGELYKPAPPGDAGATVGWEGNSVANWVGGPNPATINFFGPATLSAWEIKIDAVPAKKRSSSLYNGVCVFEEGKKYHITFKYARTVGAAGGDRHLRFTLHSAATGELLGGSHGYLDPPNNNEYKTCTFETDTIEALDAGAVNLILVLFNRGTPGTPVPMTWRVDEISIRRVDPPIIVYYSMPTGCKGIYHVVLDGVEQWPGKQKGDGWYYDLGTNRFWFDVDKVVDVGVGNNLFIYFFTRQQAQNVVADILVKAYPTVYGAAYPANRVAALDAMLNPITGVGIDRVWFDAGSTYIDAIRMLCERCNYRFYFAYDGTPRFVPTSTPAVAPTFIPFLPAHIQSPSIYQNQSEIWNRIVIEGEKIAELTGWEENMPSELKGEVFDNASMLTYGTRTKSIKNHLFQDQASIDAPVTGMCAILLALYKDPKWYLDFDMPYNAAPMEIGDTIQVEELLDIALANAVHICLIREISISLYNVTYKCQIKMPE